jgi:hypothetical protein
VTIHFLTGNGRRLFCRDSMVERPRLSNDFCPRPQSLKSSHWASKRDRTVVESSFIAYLELRTARLTGSSYSTNQALASNRCKGRDSPLKPHELDGLGWFP